MSYGRRLAHVSGTAVPGLYLAEVLPWQWLQYLVTAGAALAIVLEVVRLYVGLDWWVYDRLTREYEQNNPAGYAVAVVSAAIVVWAFEPAVAVPALLLLGIADPLAGVLSSAEGPDTRKSVPVMAVTFAVCLLIGLPFLPPRAAIPVAAVVVAADALKPRVFGFVIDDNFSIPVGAGATAWLALQVPPLL
jgi:dolichol kinase